MLTSINRRLTCGVMLALGLSVSSAATAATYTWTGDHNNVWDGFQLVNIPVAPFLGFDTNWTGDMTGLLTVPGAGDSVIFNGPSANTTIDINGGRDIQRVTFGGSTPYTLNNGSLNVNLGVTSTGNTIHAIQAGLFLPSSSAAFSVNDTSSVSINGAVTGSSVQLTKSGAGTLYLRGATPNTFGSTTVSAGTLWLDKSAGINALPGNLTVTGGTVFLDAAEQIADSASANITGGNLRIFNTTETIAGLTLGGTGVVSVENPTAKLVANNNVQINTGGLLDQTGGTVEARRDLTLNGGVYNKAAGGKLYIGDTAAAIGLIGLFIDDQNAGGTNGGHLHIQNGGSFDNPSEARIGYGTNRYGFATVTGAGSTWTNNGILDLGTFGHATLTIQAGGAVSNTGGYIGRITGSTGVATVTGSNSTWTNNGILDVGTFGHATLTIQAGGAVSSTFGYIGSELGSTGVANVTGSNSTWTNSGDLLVGNRGTGTLNVEAGGAVTNRLGYIGSELGSTGVSTVTGAGSSWTSSVYLYVGYRGTGTLNVEAGGAVSNTFGYTGYLSGSTGVVSVTGAGSSWTNSSSLEVGTSGHGTLNVQAGGEVSNTFGYIGHLTGSTGVATVAGVSSTWTNSGALLVGSSGHGTLNVQAGGAVSNTSGYIGFFSGSNGVATVTGVGSTWTNTGDLIIGGDGVNAGGTGMLTISSGGSVLVGDASLAFQGDLQVSDTTLNGEEGGHLVVMNSGQVNHGGNAVLGARVGEAGWATIVGEGSTWNNTGDLYIGAAGEGTLAIEAGGLVKNTNAFIADATGSTGEVRVENGGTWDPTGFVLVGKGGDGRLELSGGGTVANTFGIIGDQGASTSSALVTGNGSAWTNADLLVVGNFGNGTLDIQAGGAVMNAEARIGALTGSTGVATVTGAGSTWTTTGDMYVGGNDVSAGGIGTFTALDSGLVQVAGALRVWGSGAVSLDGGHIDATTIDHTLGGTFDFMDGTLSVDSFLGTLDQDGGTLRPGSSSGSTTLSGDYNLNAGSIAIEIGGLNPGSEHDQVVVAGALNLGLSSVLDVTLVNNFTPRPGDSFRILTAGELLGMFSSAAFPAIPGKPGLEWLVDYDTTQDFVTLSVAPIFAGDFDLDGDVDHDDLGLWQAGYGIGTLNTEGDANADGRVDGQDFLIWQRQYGSTAGGSLTSVPEPTSWLILLIGITASQPRTGCRRT